MIGHLKHVADKLAADGRKLQPPGDPADIDRLRVRARDELRFRLPPDHVRLLRASDGLALDGFVIYGSRDRVLMGYDDRIVDGFVEANLRRRRTEPRLRRMILFAEAPERLYAYDMREFDFRAVERRSLAAAKSYPSFEHLIGDALAERV